MPGWQLRCGDDEEAHKRTVVSPEGESNDDSGSAELLSRCDDRIASRFRLAHEEAGEPCRRQRVVSARVLDRSAESVLVPGHECDPVVLPDARDGVRQVREDALALLACAESTMECRGSPVGLHANQCAERQPRDGDAGAGRREPVLSKPEPGENEDDTAERDQLRSLLQLCGTGEPDPVGGGSAAEL